MRRAIPEQDNSGAAWGVGGKQFSDDGVSLWVSLFTLDCNNQI